MERGIMKLDTFDRIVDNMLFHIKSVRVAVLYHGGEPLLNRNFASMARKLKLLGVPYVKTVSNGMLLTESLMEDILESGLDSIEFSLDGESPEQNNMVRKNCDAMKVLSNIRLFMEKKRALSATAPAVYIATTQFKKERLNFGEQPLKYPLYISEYLSDFLDDIHGFKTTFAMKWPHMHVNNELYETTRNVQDKSGNSCDHVNNTITIRWNGDVVPCCYDLTSRYIVGNILAQDLTTIWNNDAFLVLRESICQREFISPCCACNAVNN